ncbi:MAG: carbon-nitrogen hydrolase family protein [Planctomycetota bacterium]
MTRITVLLLLLGAACSGPKHVIRMIEDGPGDRDTFRVAVLHQRSVYGDRYSPEEARRIYDRNWRKTEPLVRMAAGAGASVVVTPEYGLTGNRIALSERPYVSTVIPETPTQAPFWEVASDHTNYLDRVARLSAELKIYLVAHAVEREEDEDGDLRYYNTMVAFGPRGRLVAKYRKINLYFYEYLIESTGDETVSFETPFGRFGMLLCFDAIVPWTWHKVQRKHDVDFFIVASLWQHTPLPGRAAMNMLAAMSGLPVLWANQARGGMAGDAGIIRPFAADTAMGVWGPEGVLVGNLPLPERLRTSARLPAAGERRLPNRRP